MADVERVTALWREAAAALEEELAWDFGGAGAKRLEAAEAECGRLREQLDALREAFRTYVDATTFKSSLPDDVGSPNAPTRNAWAVARAALGVEGE